MPDDSHRARQPVLLRGPVQLLEERAAIYASCSLGRIDTHVSHPGEVDDDAAVARRETRHAVATTADGDDEVARAREAHRRDDVFDARAAGDDRGMTIGDGVPDGARAVVLGVARKDQLPAEVLP